MDRAANPPHEAIERLYTQVQAEPWAHDFFALLRRVETLSPAAPRLGCAQRPSQEALRLGQEPELDFAPASLASFSAASGLPRLGVRLFGLLGPNGPMPLHLTEYVRERARQRGDPTLARFLDVFHHRLLTLFYRAWAQHQPVVQHDRPHDDRYAAWLASACGAWAANRAGAGAALAEQALQHQAGLLASRSRHAEGLGKLLSHHFAVPVAVLGHVRHVLQIEAGDRTRLGLRDAAARLGRGATAGGQVLDRQSKFRLQLGPLTLAQYIRFLPGGCAWRALGEWVSLYAGATLRWDVELRLAPIERPAPRLGPGLRLGVTAWLGRARGDVSPLRLRPASSFLVLHPGGRHG